MNRIEQVYKDEEKEPAKNPIKNMSKSAWIILEAMLMNPHLKQRELAKIAGVKRPYVSRVQNSPVFRDTLRSLRVSAVQDRLANLAGKGITRAEEIVDNKESSDKDALDVLKTALTALGMGANQGAPAGTGNAPAVTLNLEVTPEMVEEAKRRSHKRKGLIVDTEDVED